MRSLMIIEPYAEGHRMQHVRRIACEAIRRGIRLKILTRPECLEHPSFLAIRAELNGDFETYVLSGPRLAERWVDGRSLILRQLGYFWMYREFFRGLPHRERPEVVFCPFLDWCDKMIAVLGSPFGSIPWGGLTMHLKFHYGEMGALRPEERGDRLKRRLFARLLRARDLKAVFTIDQLLLKYIQNHWQESSPKVHYVGDPVDLMGECSREEARARLDIPEGAIVLLVYGALEARKGIDVLLEAAADPRFPSRVHILLAGPQDEATREHLASPLADRLRRLGRLSERNHYLSSQEEWESFRAADLVWVGYRNYYVMSGVMIQAAAMGLPIIASEQGLIGWMAKKYGLGFVIDITDRDAVVGAVAGLATDDGIATAYGSNGRRMAEAHSSRAFAGKILDTLACQSQETTGRDRSK